MPECFGAAPIGKQKTKDLETENKPICELTERQFGLNIQVGNKTKRSRTFLFKQPANF